MLGKTRATLKWLPYYYGREVRRRMRGERVPPKHVYLCICDHFEPYCDHADRATARRRILQWTDEYPKIADKYRDSEGNILKYSFFYPEEEYQEADLKVLSDLCHAGYGEVEVHLHHENDTAENLRRRLVAFKHRLHEKHGMLARDTETGEITYGFIHGNWALNNSRPDGRWCGVNNETAVLLESGCYADFTMPSAPSETQTRKVNSIYYAVDIPGQPKSHDWGRDAEVGVRGPGLLMVQGPLSMNLSNRKYGLIPRIENGGLYGNSPPSPHRLKLWISAGISVAGRPDHVFVKLYTHGAQERVMKMLFGDGLRVLFEAIQDYQDKERAQVHFLSARAMAQKIESFCC